MMTGSQAPQYVVKIGGSLLTDSSQYGFFADQIKALTLRGAQVVVVHGGGPHLTRALERKTDIIEGYRKTPKTLIPLVEKTLIQEVYQQLSTAFQQAGLKVPPISGAGDVPVLAPQKKTPEGVALWESVGDGCPSGVDVAKINQWLQLGLVPVLPSVCPCEHTGETLNVNADEMAQAVASALKARALIVLTDTDGVYDRANATIPTLCPATASAYMADGTIKGGMVPKVRHGLRALAMGVPEVHLLNGRSLHALYQDPQAQGPSPGPGLFSPSTLGGTRLVPKAPLAMQKPPSLDTPPVPIFVSGQGPWLTSATGESYLDCVSGVAVNALGHSHPAIASTLASQGQTLIHISNLYQSPPQLRLAHRLTAHAKMDSVFFSNSGTESVEAAIKIARKYGKTLGAYKSKIIHLSGSFHGRTLGALTLTANVHYQAPFLPLIGDTEECPAGDITALKRLMNDDVCAIILEPIQGESGVRPLDPAFLQAARDLCDKYGALLIFDEVQCGMGRTGYLFAHQHPQICPPSVVPDVLCLAKGLGGGFPIGATLVKAKAAVLEAGDHGSTFGGNPLATAVANTVLDYLEDPAFLLEVQKREKQVVAHFLAHPHPLIKHITGFGLLLGLQHEAPIAPLVVQRALDAKLLLIAAGKTTTRFLPPLNIDATQVEEALKRLEIALNGCL